MDRNSKILLLGVATGFLLLVLAGRAGAQTFINDYGTPVLNLNCAVGNQCHQLAVPAPQWTAVSAPGSGTPASVSKTGAAGVQYTLSSFMACVVGNTTPVAVTISDRPAGTPTVVWEAVLAGPMCVSPAGLSIPVGLGDTVSAEFASAQGLESISLNGSSFGQTPTPTLTASPTNTVQPTDTTTPTPTPTPTNSPTATRTPTATPTP